MTDGHVLEDKSHFRGVWVFLEGRAGGLRDVSTQLIGEGRRLADLRGTTWRPSPATRLGTASTA